MKDRHYHFVTGRLAEHSLRRVVEPLAAQLGFAYSIDVLPITVAALMSPAWIARRMSAPKPTTHVLLPGYCAGNLAEIRVVAKQAIVEVGPRDLRRLPEFFGRTAEIKEYGKQNIEIIAEINHCPRLELREILNQAAALAADGADVIDVGCDPSGPWSEVGDVVAALRDNGHRVSIDSLDLREIGPAVAAGAELVLSVNSSNREAAPDWSVEVVAIPDDPKTLAGLDDTIEFLARNAVPLRIDPVLEPIGFGFGESLLRYAATRKRYPDAAMMMGVGNLTELTEVDSAGVNLLLLALCQEWRVESVLTTQVINWARSSVRECDIARQMVFHAISQSELPKHIDNRLCVIRDDGIVEPTMAELDQLAVSIRDNNFRVFAAQGAVHLIGNGLHFSDADPFLVIKQLLEANSATGGLKNLDASHAFYLGYEMHKARTALTLGKNYVQDESLDWGHLTVEEKRHYLAGQARGFKQEPPVHE